MADDVPVKEPHQSSSRLLKNAYQSRASRDFPYPSPCQARGRLVAAYIVGNGLETVPYKELPA